MTPGLAAFMKPRSTPWASIAACKFAISFPSSPCPLDFTSPTHIGRAYFGVPPEFASLSRNVGKRFRSAGAFLGLSPSKPV
jgi:hypothetical protein